MQHPFVTMDSVIDSPDLACSCAVDRERTRYEQFRVVPSRGGGWTTWAEAFARLVDRLAALPAHCLIVQQEPNQHYVQMMVGHGHAHIEVSSNHYLIGDFRLDAREESALAALGFAKPDPAGESEWPLNWWRNDEYADGEAIAGCVLAVLTTAVGFDERAPVTVDVFGADNPCESCFWAAA